MSLNTKKVGSFEIDMEVLHENPDTVRAIMAECVILRAEALMARNVVRYDAYVEAFEEVETGLAPPDYNIEVNEDGGITWKKVA